MIRLDLQSLNSLIRDSIHPVIGLKIRPIITEVE